MRFCLLAAALVLTTVANGQDIRPVALNNVVRIEAPRKSSGAPELGYGLIIGRDGPFLWIATAAHVLKWNPPADDGRDYSPRIAVRMLGSTERFEPAARPRFATDGTDVAYLQIRAPLPPGQLFEFWREAVVAGGTVPGEPVAILGSDHDSIEIGSSSGKVGADGKTIVGLPGFPAQSGAPVATTNGIVGLYLGAGPNGPQDARIVTMEEVSKGATKLEVRWQLGENGGVSNYITRVCIKHTGTDHPEAIIAAVQTSSSAGGPQCANVRAGRVPVYSADPDLVCSPNPVQLAQIPTQEITLDCRINIAGEWTNPDLGGGRFTPLSPGIWAFEGLDTGPYGQVTGRVSGKPPRVFFEGQTSQGRPLSGFMSIERGKISFSFILLSTTTPFDGVLRR